MIEINEEKFSVILPEFKKIVPSIFSEVDIYPENPEPNVDYNQFDILEKAGYLQFITVRNKKNDIVGVHATHISPDIFYKHIKTAFVLFYFLDKSHRGKGEGERLFSFSLDKMKEKEVERVFMSRKIYIPNEKLFDTLGFTHIENNYTKYIGK